MMPSPAIYRGTVVHARLAPRAHKLRYGVAAVLFDVDTLDDDLRRLRLMSRNAANLMSFHDADHGDGTGEPVSVYARRALEAAGLHGCGRRIMLLCYPRLLGYAFNPLSVFYCYDAGGALGALIYEVNNTWGERVSYVVAAGACRNGVYVHGCAKTMSVSPFTNNDGRYRFSIRPPRENLVLGITFSDASGPILKTHFQGAALPLDDRSLLGVALRYPAMTLKVIGAIHWEALKLYLKGVPLVPRRKSAPHAISIAPR